MQLPFNAFDYDPTQGASVCFPLADYRVEITAAEPKVVKDNPGAGYLELSLTVTDGDMRGLTQKDRLNIFNPSEVAKRIAHQQLAAYCFAINRPYLQDSQQLLGGRLICTIGPQEDQPKYSEVKVVKCPDGSLPTRPQQQAQDIQPPQAAPPPPPAAPAPTAPPAAQQWGPAPVAPPVQAPAPAAAPPWAAAQPVTGMGAPPAAAAPATPPWAR